MHGIFKILDGYLMALQYAHTIQPPVANAARFSAGLGRAYQSFWHIFVIKNRRRSKTARFSVKIMPTPAGLISILF